MKKLLCFLFFATLSAPAFAQPKPPVRPPIQAPIKLIPATAPSDNTKITLTYGDLKALLASQLLQGQLQAQYTAQNAAGAMQRLQEQFTHVGKPKN